MNRFPDVVEWDEYGQGYNADGECVVCICGRRDCTDPHVDPGDWRSDGGDASHAILLDASDFGEL